MPIIKNLPQMVLLPQGHWQELVAAAASKELVS